MRRFIAIDPSTTFTGWSVFQDELLVAWGHINTQGAPYADRFSFIIESLTSAALKYGVREIAVEDVKFAWHGKNRNRNIAGLQVVFRSIQDWAKEVRFPIRAHNPATWKNAVVGHPNAGKETTKENICFRFPRLQRNLTEHEYDAIGIGLYHGGLLKLEAMARGF